MYRETCVFVCIRIFMCVCCAFCVYLLCLCWFLIWNCVLYRVSRAHRVFPERVTLARSLQLLCPRWSRLTCFRLKLEPAHSQSLEVLPREWSHPRDTHWQLLPKVAVPRATLDNYCQWGRPEGQPLTIIVKGKAPRATIDNYCQWGGPHGNSWQLLSKGVVPRATLDNCCQRGLSQGQPLTIIVKGKAPKATVDNDCQGYRLQDHKNKQNTLRMFK